MEGPLLALHLSAAAVYGHRGFTYIDPNLIMILLVLFSLGTSGRLGTHKSHRKEMTA